MSTLPTDSAGPAGAAAAAADVVARLRECRLVPVSTMEDPARARDVAAALLAGGVSCIEVTFRYPRAAEAIAAARTVSGMLVGAGTVLRPEQADAAAAAGAHFAVAPGLDEAVLARCRALGLPYFPGVATPTEIGKAHALGLDLVKVFPAAQLGGPGFVRAVSEVFPGVNFMPTGGISMANLADYVVLPQIVACGGSWLVRPDVVREGRFDEIEAFARAARSIVEGVAPA